MGLRPQLPTGTRPAGSEHKRQNLAADLAAPGFDRPPPINVGAHQEEAADLGPKRGPVVPLVYKTVQHQSRIIHKVACQATAPEEPMHLTGHYATLSFRGQDR